MHWPYSLEFGDSFLATQWGSALLLSAMLFAWRVPRGARAMLLAGVWLAALSTSLGPDAQALGVMMGPRFFRHVLLAAATFGTVAAVLAARPGVAVVALAAQVPLWLLTGYILLSDPELAALHQAWLGLLTGVLATPARADVP